jgi:hypothetical protein
MKDKWKVSLKSFKMGDDWVLLLQGGEKPHIGAVALAVPYKETASASLISAPRHKDGDLAKPLSEKVAKELKTKVTLVVGIHVDDATQKDINQLINNSKSMINNFIEKTRDEK